MNPTHTELWLPIPGCEGAYEVSDHGRIRSLDRTIQTKTGPQLHRGRLLRQNLNKATGYFDIKLRGAEGAERLYVHSMVLETFKGARPAGLYCCHNDGNPANNRLSNLRWDSQSANMRDRRRHGTDHNVNKTHCVNGHPFNKVNTIYRADRNGARECRACQRTRRSPASIRTRRRVEGELGYASV